MTTYSESSNLGGSFLQDHAGRRERPSRQIDHFPSFDALLLVNGVGSAVRRRVGGISGWRKRRATIRELQALSEHLLTDIGLDRSQLASTVEEIIATGGRPA